MLVICEDHGVELCYNENDGDCPACMERKHVQNLRKTYDDLVLELNRIKEELEALKTKST